MSDVSRPRRIQNPKHWNWRTALFAILLIAGLRTSSGDAVAQVLSSPQPQFWYYCYDPPGYFPYVQHCNSSWREVPVPRDNPPVTPHIDSPAVKPPAAGNPQRDSSPHTDSSDNSIIPNTSQKNPAVQTYVPPTQPTQRAVPQSTPTPSVAKPNVSPSAPIHSGATLNLLILVVILIVCGFIANTSLKKSVTENQPVITSMRRWHSRWRYAWLVVAATVAIAILAPSGAYAFYVGLPAAGLIVASLGRTQLPANISNATAEFASAAQRIAALRSALHFNHGEYFKMGWAKRVEGVSSSQPFLYIHSASRLLIITPERYWARIGKVYVTASTNTIDAKSFSYESSEASPRQTDQVLGQTWLHATKSGDRDRRYKENYLLYRVRRFGIELKPHDKTEWNLAGMDQSTSDVALTAFQALTGHKREDTSRANNNNSGYRSRNNQDHSRREQSHQKQSWYVVLGVDKSASREEITSARNKLVREYHPDRLKSVEGLSPDFERLANQKLAEINAAYKEALAALNR